MIIGILFGLSIFTSLALLSPVLKKLKKEVKMLFHDCLDLKDGVIFKLIFKI